MQIDLETGIPNLISQMLAKQFMHLKGDVYTGLDAYHLKDKDIDFCTAALAYALWSIWFIASFRFNDALSFRDGY